MINAWDTFDRIVCVHYANHVARKQRLLVELDRVGMLSSAKDRFSFHTTSNSASDSYVYNCLKDAGVDLPPTVGQFKVAFAHHEVIRCALAEGCSSLLILENDIRFLKDADMVHGIMSTWRESLCDLVLFDRFVWTSNVRPFYTSGGSKYFGFDCRVRGGSCYVLSRKGMESAVNEFDCCFTSGERKVYIGDMLYDRMSVGKCYSATCACVQQNYDDCLNLSVYGTRGYDVYRRNGVDLSLYNIDTDGSAV